MDQPNMASERGSILDHSLPPIPTTSTGTTTAASSETATPTPTTSHPATGSEPPYSSLGPVTRQDLVYMNLPPQRSESNEYERVDELPRPQQVIRPSRDGMSTWMNDPNNSDYDRIDDLSLSAEPDYIDPVQATATSGEQGQGQRIKRVTTLDHVPSDTGSVVLKGPKGERKNTSSGDSQDSEAEEYTFLSLPSGKTRFIFTHLIDDLEQVRLQTTSPDDFAFLPSLESDNSGVLVLGNKNDAALGVGKMLIEHQKIQLVEHTVKDKGFLSYLLTENGQSELRNIEQSQKMTFEIVESSITANAPQDEQPKDSLTTNEDIYIKMIKGLIEDEQSDVIVNSVSMYGGLGLGQVSQRLSSRGGPKVEAEFKRKSINQQIGSITETTGGNLLGKKLYHVVCPEWQGGSSRSEYELRELVRKCLSRANKDKCKTISFPALGSGKLKYPPQKVASVLLDESMTFSKTAKKLYLKFIRFIIHPDQTNVIEGFQKVFKTTLSIPQGPTIQFPYTLTTPDGVDFTISKGSIIDAKVDVLVNTTSKELQLATGLVSALLLKKAGPHIQTECNNARPNGVDFGDICPTTAGSLPCKYIYHGALPPFKDVKYNTEKLFRSLISNCLEKGHRDEMRHMAMPTIGAGTLGYPPDFMLRFIIEEILKFSSNKTWTTLKDIRLVVFDDKVLASISEYLKRNIHTIWPSPAAGQDNEDEDKTNSVQLPDSSVMLVYGYDDLQMTTICQELNDHYLLNVVDRRLDSDELKMKLRLFTPTQLDILRGVQRTCGVYLEVGVTKGQEFIRINGYNKNIDKAMTFLDDILKQIGGIRTSIVLDYFPPNWSRMEHGETCVLVDLGEQDSEYDKVVKGLKDTYTPKTIEKVQRVQNSVLYTQYLAQKVLMKSQASDERSLYHGTTHSVIKSINKYGFNRRFCGKNGISYGRGVYFARDARYSCKKRYSRPDADGLRYLYRCSVLVGKYTEGKGSMNVPPLIDASMDDTDRFDSTVDSIKDPKLFAIFNDVQAYPEYLITFR